MEININYYKKNTSTTFIDIEVIDDGVGFSKSHRDGFGLSGIRERINEIKGKIIIMSEQNQGVKLKIQLPLLKKKK